MLTEKEFSSSYPSSYWTCTKCYKVASICYFCSNCRLDYAYWSDTTCVYNCSSCSSGSGVCPTCSGNKTIYTYCSHDLATSHRYCDHYENTEITEHKICDHSADGVEHE